MRRIVGFVGSPRKNGNTHILVSKILDGAEREGAKVKLVFLYELNIKECDQCGDCLEGKDCSIKDDMIELYTKVVESDVIIFGTPLYWYAPTALMKLFIDRLFYFIYPENLKKMKGKIAIVVSPFEDDDPKAANLLIEFFKKIFIFFKIDLYEKILVPGVGKKGDILKKKEVLTIAYKLGERLGSE